MVLSKNDILYRCEHQNLIENYCQDNIQTCSYDLRMGSQYYYATHISDDTVKIGSLQKGEILKIPPDAICYVITEESVNMPSDLTASISLPLKLIKCGVMLAAQPPYDPGYHGKTIALLHNLSNETVKIKYGQHILNIVFTKLSRPVEEYQKYKGDYQELTDLKDFCQEVRVGAVFELRQKLMKWTERFNKAVPNILSAISVALAILTLVVGIPSVVNTWNPSSYPEFFINERENTLTIFMDGQCYEIDLKQDESQPEN